MAPEEIPHVKGYILLIQNFQFKSRDLHVIKVTPMYGLDPGIDHHWFRCRAG